MSDIAEIAEKSEESKTVKYLKLAVKIAFTIFAVYLILTKTDTDKIVGYLKGMDPFYVLLALVALNFGQVISAFRTRFYFTTENFWFRKYFSISLYYVGMFFNRLLPGGIGGDGYVAYWLKKNHKIRLRTSVRLLVSSRASGLLLLMVFAFLLGIFSNVSDIFKSWNLLMIIGIVLTILCYTFLANKLLKEKFQTQVKALKYSVIVQGMVVVASAALFIGTGHSENLVDYLMLFMVSSVVTLVPISFGGAGMRELTYFYGAGLIGLNPELGIAVSVVYFLLDTVSSLAGLYFWHRIDGIEVFDERTKGEV